ncbi:MAG: hypothetical protein IPM98_01985 [Lewinellaceae bacterium]|nr:hypothetical protein [Lewinellaceae bacterium]
MSKQIILTSDKISGKQLSKEQQQFNTLVNKIKTVRVQIEQAQEADLELRRIGEERVAPAENTAKAATREWILALHHSPFQAKLSKKMKDKFPLIMLEELQPLLETSLYGDDAELHAIYEHYEGSGRRYQDIQEEDENLLKNMAADMMNNMYGMNLNPEDLDDPATMREKITARQAEYEAEERARAEKKAQRKKSDAALAAEEKRQAAEAAVKKTAKQIYMDLVRHFHPDREPDETLRAEKTEVMKQVTSAYEANDHLLLLELQLSLLSGRDNAVLQFDKAQLRHFNQSLQNQLRELEQELFFASPAGSGNLYAMLYHPNRKQMLAQIERHIAEMKKMTRGLQGNIRLIQQDVQVFKEFVRDYELTDDGFDDFLPDFWK